jgi:hypothetical protein
MSELFNISKDYFNKGIFVFENGEYIFIEEIQYSHDGSYWEKTFLPYEHSDPRDLTKTIKGHQYRRVRHAGDDEFQLPEYIVAKDGYSPVLRVNGKQLEYKYNNETDEMYRPLFDLNLLKGDKGEQGAVGRGWAIDQAGFFYDRPLSPTCTHTWTSTCNSCNPAVSIPVGGTIYTYLSIGDGGHIVTAQNVTDAWYRSEDGLLFVELRVSDIGTRVTWTAEDAIGTGKIDYRTTDYLNTAGHVYVFYNGIWKEVFNVSIPFYKLAPSAAYFSLTQNGFYMEEYTDSLAVPSAVELKNPSAGIYKLDVKEDSINLVHIDEAIFGDGLEVDAPLLQVKSSDFTGFGMSTYTSLIDGEVNQQVDMTALVGNGLDTFHDILNETDGETRELAIVKVSDLVDENLSGLTTFTNTDTFNDLKVKVYHGLEITTDGVMPDVDELSLTTEEVGNKLKVKNYGAGSEGIMAVHLNPNAANENAGLHVNNSTGIEVKLSTDHKALTFDNLGVKLDNHKVEGWHLNHNVANAATGAIVMNETTDLLNVIVKPAGGIIIDGASGLAFDTSDLSWLNNYVVKKIQIGTDDLTGDLAMIGDVSSDVYISTYVEHTGPIIKVRGEMDVVALTALITSVAGGLPIGSHTHSIAQVAGLQAALDAKVTRDFKYGNMKIITVGTANDMGLWLESPSGTWYKLIVSDDGQLGTY